jgi:hypothetical protein
MKLRDTIIWILFSLAIISIFFWFSYRKDKLKNDYILLTCKIISITSNFRSTASFQCELFYKGERKVIGSDSNVEKKRLFIGKYFPIAYSPEIDMGQILISPKDFKKYNIAFPDSLNWVSDYKY